MKLNIEIESLWLVGLGIGYTDKTLFIFIPFLAISFSLNKIEV